MSDHAVPFSTLLQQLSDAHRHEADDVPIETVSSMIEEITGFSLSDDTLITNKHDQDTVHHLLETLYTHLSSLHITPDFLPVRSNVTIAHISVSGEKTTLKKQVQVFIDHLKEQLGTIDKLHRSVDTHHCSQEVKADALITILSTYIQHFEAMETIGHLEEIAPTAPSQTKGSNPLSTVIKKEGALLSATIHFEHVDGSKKDLVITSKTHPNVFDEEGFFDHVVAYDSIEENSFKMIFNETSKLNTMRVYTNDTFNRLNEVNPETKQQITSFFHVTSEGGRLVAKEINKAQESESIDPNPLYAVAAITLIAVPTQEEIDRKIEIEKKRMNTLIDLIAILLIIFILEYYIKRMKEAQKEKDFLLRELTRKKTHSQRKISVHHIRHDIKQVNRAQFEKKVDFFDLDETPYDTTTFELIPIVTLIGQYKDIVIMLKTVLSTYKKMKKLSEHISFNIHAIIRHFIAQTQPKNDLDNPDAPLNAYMKKHYEDISFTHDLLKTPDLFSRLKKQGSIPRSSLLPFQVMQKIQSFKEYFIDLVDTMKDISDHRRLEQLKENTAKLEHTLTSMKSSKIKKTLSSLIAQQGETHHFLTGFLEHFSQNSLPGLGYILEHQSQVMNRYFSGINTMANSGIQTGPIMHKK